MPAEKAKSEKHLALCVSAKGRANEIAKKFGGGYHEDKPTIETPFKKLLDFHIDTSSEAADKEPETVNVPVWMTVMIKKLEDDPEHENMVQLSGTIIQRTLFFDATRTTPDPKKGARNGFEAR